MRITNNMLMNNMLNYIGNNLGRMDRYQSQMATGKKISVPSDDPVVAARALRLRTDVAEVAQFKRNVSDATSWMEMTESVLSDMTNIFQRARELAVDGSNGSKTPDDMQKIAAEIDQLKEQIIKLANSTYAGRNIFSGFKTDESLIADDGTFNINVENSEHIEYEIGIGDSIYINVPGGELFNNGLDVVGAPAATSGKAEGDLDITFPLTINAGVNDSLDIIVDDNPPVPATATITPGTYNDISSIATEVEMRINTALGGAASVTVIPKGDRLEFTSTSTGVDSKIDINGASTAAADLGVVTTTRIDGVDVSGKIISPATSGKAEGDFSVTFPLTIDGTNDVFNMQVDGEAVSININQTTYNDIGTLAAEIETKVNAATAVAEDITVTPKGNRLEFTSGSTGVDSTIVIDGASTAAGALGVVTTTTLDGVDATVGQKGKLIQDFEDFVTALNNGDHAAVGNMIATLDEDMSNLLRVRADVGARTNRLELTGNRLDTDTVNFTKLMSLNEDVDMSETIMNLKNEENVYRASLAGGARIIMPTLMDFLR